MKLPKITLRLALLGCALTLCVLAGEGRATAATCTDGDTRWIFANACCSGPHGPVGEQKEQSCIKGVWTDNGLFECAGVCPPPT